MTTDKKRQCLPLYFIWQRQQCYPLCFSSWRPIKNNSVTPWVFFHDDQSKTTELPLVFSFLTTNKIRHCYPLYFIWQRQQCYPLCFSSWRQIKNNIVTPCVFFHDDQSKTTVLPLLVFFMTTKEKLQCHPSCFIW